MILRVELIQVEDGDEADGLLHELAKEGHLSYEVHRVLVHEYKRIDPGRLPLAAALLPSAFTGLTCEHRARWTQWATCSSAPRMLPQELILCSMYAS